MNESEVALWCAEICEKKSETLYHEHGVQDPETGAWEIGTRYMDSIEAYDDCAETLRTYAATLPADDSVRVPADGEPASAVINVSFKTHLRPDGDIVRVTITQGDVEIQLTKDQAHSLATRLKVQP